MKNTDYSKIAETYNESKTRHSIAPDVHISGILRKKKHIKVLDVGCGTGNYLFRQQEYFSEKGSVEWFGIEPSEDMLHVLKGNLEDDSITVKLAAAEDIPFKDFTFDYIICNHSYHHFIDKHKAFSEIYRVLKKRGVLHINTIHPYDMKKSWVYQFFPAVYEEDILRFYTSDQLFEALETVGFDTKTEKKIMTFRRSMEDIHAEAQLRNYSQLHLISDTEFEVGLASIRNYMLTNKSLLVEHAKLYPIAFKR
ncbi:MAG: class I SAM-dependent methyltransferase [Bacteroidota bacterium]